MTIGRLLGRCISFSAYAVGNSDAGLTASRSAILTLHVKHGALAHDRATRIIMSQTR